MFLLIVLGVVLCLRNKKGAHQTKGTMITVRASQGLQCGCSLSPMLGPPSAHAYVSPGWHHPRAQTGISAQPVSMVVGGASASSEEKGRDAVVVSSVEIQMTTVACPSWLALLLCVPTSHERWKYCSISKLRHARGSAHSIGRRTTSQRFDDELASGGAAWWLLNEMALRIERRCGSLEAGGKLEGGSQDALQFFRVSGCV